MRSTPEETLHKVRFAKQLIVTGTSVKKASKIVGVSEPILRKHGVSAKLRKSPSMNTDLEQSIQIDLTNYNNQTLVDEVQRLREEAAGLRREGARVKSEANALRRQRHSKEEAREKTQIAKWCLTEANNLDKDADELAESADHTALAYGSVGLKILSREDEAEEYLQSGMASSSADAYTLVDMSKENAKLMRATSGLPPAPHGLLKSIYAEAIIS